MKDIAAYRDELAELLRLGLRQMKMKWCSGDVLGVTAEEGQKRSHRNDAERSGTISRKRGRDRPGRAKGEAHAGVREEHRRAARMGVNG
ncbi:MAG: hypothetical protein ACM30E_09300 [Nitrososphaerales archaeon]